MLRFLLGISLLCQSIAVSAQENTESNIHSSYVVGGAFNFLVQNNSYPLSSLGVISGIGGIGSIYSDSDESIKNTSFTFNPYIAKDLNDHQTVGLQANIAFAKYTRSNIIIQGQMDPINFERKSNQYGADIFFRQILNPTAKLNFFLQPNMGYNILKEEESYGNTSSSTQKAWFFNLALNLGLIYNFNDRIRATATMGALSYATGKWRIEGTSTEKSFNTFQSRLRLSSIAFGLEFRL